jgi:putative membrane protein
MSTKKFKSIVRGGFLVSTLAAVTAYAAGKAPTDAEIAGIVVAANTVDVEAGKFAETRVTSAEVKDFAKLMVTDHTAVNNQASALATKLKLVPAESDTSKSLKQGGKANLDKLKTLKGPAFEQAYVKNEVVYHQAVLEAIDTVLIPNAKNAELKDLLQKVRPAISAHLDHAKRIEAAMTKTN